MERDFTVVGFLLTTEEAVAEHVRATAWFEAVHVIARRYPDLRLAGVLDRQVDMVGRWENLPEAPPRWQPDMTRDPMRYTVFGLDLHAERAHADIVEARDWASAAFTAIRARPASYRFICVAPGQLPWADGGRATWHTLAGLLKAKGR